MVQRRLVVYVVVFSAISLLCSILTLSSSGWLGPPLRRSSDNGENSLQRTDSSSIETSTMRHIVTIFNTTHGKEAIINRSLSTARAGTTVSGRNELVATTTSCPLINCFSHLSPHEQIKYNKCKLDTEHRFGARVKRSKCHFLSDSSREAVALVSSEGSGNTWLRGLLEKATDVCTGFCCCDYSMRARGFAGEGVNSGKVLVVKTHFSIAQWVGDVKRVSWEGSYGSAVVLVRNPAMAAVAEWNRKVTNKLKRNTEANRNTDPHTNTISEDHFRTNEWTNFLDNYLRKWKKRLVNWVLNNHTNHPVHVVNYEDLKSDTVGEVEKILDFLHFPYSHDEVVERLREDYTVFQRPHKDVNFEHFSPEQKEKLRDALLNVMAAAKDCGKEKLLLFNDYLEVLPDVT